MTLQLLLHRWLAAALATGLLAAATIPLHAQPVSVADDSGQVLKLPAPAQRAIALSPHLAELVFAAGAGDRLVGVMRFADHPPAAARLPVVGDAFALNLEVIASLKPDLLLLWTSGINPRQQQRLQTLGLPTYASDSSTVAGIADTLRRLGRLFGTQAVAEAAATQTEQRWAALRARYAARIPVRVFYQLWHEPLMTINRQHLMHQAITACGGVNVFADQPLATPHHRLGSRGAGQPAAGGQRRQPPTSRPACKAGVALPGSTPCAWTRWWRWTSTGWRACRQPLSTGAQALCEAIDRARQAVAQRP